MAKKKEQEQVFEGIKIAKPKLKDEIAQLSLRDDNNSFGAILPTPDLIFRKLGKQQKNVYKQLLTDPYLQGLIQSRKAGTLQLEHTIAGNEVSEDIINAVWEMLDGINLHNLTSSILDAPLYGYQPIEIIWGEKDGKYYPTKALAKPFHWFGFTPEGELMYKKDDYDEDGKEPPAMKFLIPRYEDSYENPYGTPLLAYCYWNVFFKTKGFEFWAEFAEKFGSPNLLIKYNGDADEAKLYELYQSFVNMISNGVITVPAKFDPQILNGATSSSINIYQSLIENSKKEMEVLLLGHESSASSEAGKLGNNNQTMDVNERIINTDKRLVVTTINELIKWFVQINYGEQEFYPEYVYKQAENLQVEKVDRDNKLLMLNPNLQFSKQYIVDTYGIDEQYLETVGVAGGDGDLPDPKLVSARMEGQYKPYLQRTVFMAEEFEDQKLADDFIDKVLLKLDNDKTFNKWISTIYSTAVRYDDLKALKGNYHKAYSKINSDSFMQVIERAFFVIQLLGYHYSAEEQEAVELNSTAYIPTMKTSIKLKDLEFAFNKSPEDAVKYFKKKGFAVPKNFKEYIKAVRTHAFTIAGVTKMSILSDFKELITEGLEGGLSISEFRKKMKARLAEKGWAKTDVATNHRIDKIYRTNTQEALSIGRLKQMQSVKTNFPYLQNIVILDNSTTKECKFLNGKIFNQNDKGFLKNYAPMGHYGCRRRLRALTERMFKNIKAGLYKSSMPAVQKHINHKHFRNKTKPYSPDLREFPNELTNEYKKEQ